MNVKHWISSKLRNLADCLDPVESEPSLKRFSREEIEKHSPEKIVEFIIQTIDPSEIFEFLEEDMLSPSHFQVSIIKVSEAAGSVFARIKYKPEDYVLASVELFFLYPEMYWIPEVLLSSDACLRFFSVITLHIMQKFETHYLELADVSAAEYPRDTTAEIILRNWDDESEHLVYHKDRSLSFHSLRYSITAQATSSPNPE